MKEGSETNPQRTSDRLFLKLLLEICLPPFLHSVLLSQPISTCAAAAASGAGEASHQIEAAATRLLTRPVARPGRLGSGLDEKTRGECPYRPAAKTYLEV